MTYRVRKLLSASGKNMKKSAIREILKHLKKPGMISFAGGLPAPESFPAEDLIDITTDILKNNGPDGLQYGTTEGDLRLRELLADRHRKHGISITADNLIITTGSQQAIDLISRIFIDPGDYVLCGLPSYLGGINTFQVYGAKLKGIPLDENGMIPEELEETVIHLLDLGRKIKFIYVIPDFQNPAGITMPRERRKKIIEIARRHDLLIIEDSPYREIRFEGEHQPLMYELDPEHNVLSLFTFSKIFAPGFRVGWVIGDSYILDRIVTAKQTADLCTSTFVQKIIAEYLDQGLLEKNLIKTINLYRQRRDHMIRCLSKYMPEYVKWTKPEGGLFLFLTLPGNYDTDILFNNALDKNVAFVSGSTFFCNNKGRNTMRINFSYTGPEETEEGIRRLSEVIREYKP